MIDRIKRLYPEYLIFIKKDDKLFDLSNNIVKDFKLFQKRKHIIVSDNAYEVHFKVK